MTIDTVIFDWGGTLTPWVPFDPRSWWRIAGSLVENERVETVAAALLAADIEVWTRARDEHRSGTLEAIFRAAGLEPDTAAYKAFDADWEQRTLLDPDAPTMFAGLRDRGIRIGVLSNTTWPRSRHEQIFERDGVLGLIDGAVYTSEIPWTKPHPEAFRAAMAAVSADDAGRCVFVGDRPFDDIHGAGRVGMRTVLVPHSTIPDAERVIDGVPDAVIQRLADVVPLIDAWRDGVQAGFSGDPPGSGPRP